MPTRQKLILSIMLLLLFSVLNIEAKNTDAKKTKIDKQSSTNSLIAKKISDKEKVDKKKAVFDKNLNVALLTDEELNQLINDALLNCNNAELMELGTKLGIAQKYDLTPIISSAIVARTKCDVKKARQRCIYASKCFFRDITKDKITDETRKIMDEAINGVPIGCQDWLAVGQMVSATPLAMDIYFCNDNDFDKGWSTYKNCVLAINACKSASKKTRGKAVDYLNNEEGITQLLRNITRDESRKKIQLSLENAREMKSLVESLPSDNFRNGEKMKQNILKSFQTYIDGK